MGDELDSGLHCALGETAWTDLFSNQTRIAGLDQPSDVIHLFSTNKIPDSSVSSFLHESVHNYCFQSPVGLSAAYLHFLTLLEMTYGSQSTERVRANWLRTMTLHKVMRPLAEGLALFCEFDTAPRASDDCWSHSMWWLYFFTEPLSKEEHQSAKTFGDGLYRRLMTLRRSKEWIRHKQSLLIEPFDNRNGGYLSGYMTVKRLWYWSAIRSKNFQNKDFFLRYVTNYFYGDLGLVYALHSEKFSFETSLNEIPLYFQLRLNEFFQLDFDEEAAKLMAHDQEIDKLAASRQFGAANNLLCELGISNDDWAPGKEALLAMKARVAVRNPTNDADRLLMLAGRYLAQRELLSMAQQQVEIRSVSKTRFEMLIDGMWVGEAPYFAGMEGRTGTATLAYYISIIHKRIVHCVTQGKDIVSLVVFEQAPTGIPARQIRQYMLAFAELQQLSEGLTTVYRAAVLQHQGEFDIPKTMKKVDRTVSLIYAQCALRGAKDNHQCRRIYSKMKARGFYGLLGKRELVAALAAVTVGASMASGMDEVLGIFKSTFPDLDDQLTQLQAASEASGFTFYEEQASAILSFA